MPGWSVLVQPTSIARYERLNSACCRSSRAARISPSPTCSLYSTVCARTHLRSSILRPAVSDHQMIGDNIQGAKSAPTTVGVAMGLNARYIMFDPAQNLTIVSIGSARGWATDCWGGYDDAFTVGLVWNLLGPAVTPVPTSSSATEQAREQRVEEARLTEVRRQELLQV